MNRKADIIRMKYKLSDTEYRLMEFIWEKEPLTTTELSKLCLQAFDWKKSTVYTMLKRMGEKEVLIVKDSVISSLIKKETADRMESEALIEKSFGGSLPNFLAAFLQDRKITKQEAEKLQQLIKEAAND